MALTLASSARGLSEVEFWERYGSEEQCRSAIAEMRWRDGFSCPGCDHKGHAFLKKRGHWQCNRCKHQVSVTSGTIFHSTKLPLTVWFLAIYHLSQSKGGISSVELGRRLGVRQGTAWNLKQKLMQAMLLREATKPKFDGRVEIDWTPIWAGNAAASEAAVLLAKHRLSPRWRRRRTRNHGGFD